MPPTDEQQKLIELLAKNEETIHNLYQLFSQKYPEYKNLWQRLAVEETGHASVIRSLYLHFKAEDWIKVNPDRFPPQAIQTFNDHVQRLIQDFQTENHPAIKAFSLAHDLEKALLESHYFEIYEGDSARFKQTLERLKQETTRHLNSVTQTLEKLKPPSSSDNV